MLYYVGDKDGRMLANHIHDALAQVRALQEFLIERNVFKGYSGTARLVSAAAALLGAAALGSARMPASPWAHLAGWGVVLVVGVIANYAALFYWFLFDRHVGRNPLMLKPALDALPALALGGVLSVVLIHRRDFDLLFGIWTALYGLAQVAYRHSLPRGMYEIGLLYMVAGVFFLLSPHTRFTNPWPMGLVFFTGELAGGWILIRDHRRSTTPDGER
jgi:hypothetical protein